MKKWLTSKIVNLTDTQLLREMYAISKFESNLKMRELLRVQN